MKSVVTENWGRELWTTYGEMVAPLDQWWIVGSEASRGEERRSEARRGKQKVAPVVRRQEWLSVLERTRGHKLEWFVRGKSAGDGNGEGDSFFSD